MSPRVPPHSVGAEESLLGAVLVSPTALSAVAELLRPEDFYSPANGAVYAAALALHQRGATVDTMTVAEALGAGLEQVGGPQRLVSLIANVPSTTGAPSYAEVVVRKACLRRLIGVSAELAESAYAESDPAEVVDATRLRLAEVDLPSQSVEEGPHLFDFLEEAEDREDWLIPAMLERQDRMILTGGEGGGKSEMLRQVAVQATAGIVPFSPTETRCDPLRVMLVDCENPTVLLRRKLDRIYRLCPSDYDPRRMVVLSRPQGLNLLARADRQWLAERVVANRPDILVIGPHYKLHMDDPVKEEPARALAGFLDDLRIRHGMGLLMEAHQPHAAAVGKRTLRPIGASLWLRWPEIGVGIETDEEGDKVTYKLTQWRGFRDDRRWPRNMHRDGRWPWTSGKAPLVKYEKPEPRQERF